MSLTFHVTTNNKVGVIQLSGRMISSDDTQEIVTAVQQHIDNGTFHWVCDCAALEYCNSTGLNFFVRTLTKSRNAGGDCALVNLQPGVEKLFQLSKLNEIFTNHQSVEDAVLNYNSNL